MEGKDDALVVNFNYHLAIQDAVKKLEGRRIELAAYIDSLTFFDVVTKDRSAEEMSLRIYVLALKGVIVARSSEAMQGTEVSQCDRCVDERTVINEFT